MVERMSERAACILGHRSLVALAAGHLAGEQAMIDEVGGQQLVYRVQVSPGLLAPQKRRTRALFFSSSTDTGASSSLPTRGLSLTVDTLLMPFSKAADAVAHARPMRLILHPLCEPPHSGMVLSATSEVVTSCKLCVVDRDVYVSVTWTAQSDRPTWVASLYSLRTLPPAIHLSGTRASERDDDG